MELKVVALLKKKGIKYVHESFRNGINQRLDFYLPDFDVYIECKQMSSDRTIDQLASQDNVIVIQGKKSIEFLEKIL